MALPDYLSHYDGEQLRMVDGMLCHRIEGVSAWGAPWREDWLPCHPQPDWDRMTREERDALIAELTAPPEAP